MVHFIGAGPGDPELLTIKGKKLIDQADVIIYAGSLVNKEVLAGAKEGAKIYNSATMTLEEVIDVMKDADARGLDVARVHTGDPAIFGAHREQMDELSRLGIEYEVIPGVSSFLATAAALKKEYTLPGVSQRQRRADPVPAVPDPAAAAEGVAARHHGPGHAAARRPGDGHPPRGQCGDAQPLPPGRPGKVHPVRQQAPLGGGGRGEPGPFAGEPEQDRI